MYVRVSAVCICIVVLLFLIKIAYLDLTYFLHCILYRLQILSTYDILVSDMIPA